MHPANEAFWARCKDRYPLFFKGTRVLEFGSYDINGSIRRFFSEAKQYVGIDWRPGPGVDLVSLAHEVNLAPADAVVSASMLEHDPFWEASLSNMVDHLCVEGIMILTWGCAGNPEHCLEEAPDGEFHPLRAGLVIQRLVDCGMHIQEFHYERSVASGGYVGGLDGTGEACLVAFKHPVVLRGYAQFAGRDDLLPKDQ